MTETPDEPRYPGDPLVPNWPETSGPPTDPETGEALEQSSTRESGE